VGIGSRGDVQPLLALGQTLRARGHSVLIAAAPNFAAWVQSLGFDFAPVGVDMQQFLADNPDTLTGNAFKAGPIQSRFFASELPRQMQELLAICQRADALVWGGLGFAAPSVAERLGIPVLGVLYTTCVLPSTLHAPPTVRSRGLPRWLNRTLWWLHDRVAARMVAQPLNQARQRLGLAPVDLHTHLLEQCDYAVAVDETLFPADPAWPQSVRRTGYLLLDDPTPLDAELDAWLADGEAPVYVGFGSMAGAATQRMDALLLEALQGNGQRYLIAAGWSGMGGQTLPAQWRRIAAAPHAQLFPRMAAVIHHGGSGTMASALHAGVPQVLLPLILDQYHHAHVLHRAGLTPKPIAMERITAAQLAAAVAAALAWPRAPLQAVALRLQQCDANARTATQIEALAKDGRSTFKLDTT
jgi:UDP:flavonoid glycosyltransferase YjiC (YdhE family)